MEDKDENFRYVVHSDADWKTPKSVSGAFHYIRGDKGSFMPLHYSSSQQSICAGSSAESELIAGHVAIKDSFRICDSITKNIETDKQIIYYGDNDAAESAYEKGYSVKLAHLGRTIGVRAAFMREQIEANEVNFNHVDSDLNKANILTKVVGPIDFERQRQMLGIWKSPESIPRCMENENKYSGILERIMSDNEGHFLWRSVAETKTKDIMTILKEIDIGLEPNKIVVKNNTTKVPKPVPKKEKKNDKFSPTRVYIGKEEMSGAFRIGVDCWKEDPKVLYSMCVAIFFSNSEKEGEDTKTEKLKDEGVNKDIVTLLKINKVGGPAVGDEALEDTVGDLRKKSENKLEPSPNKECGIRKRLLERRQKAMSARMKEASRNEDKSYPEGQWEREGDGSRPRTELSVKMAKSDLRERVKGRLRAYLGERSRDQQ